MNQKNNKKEIQKIKNSNSLKYYNNQSLEYCIAIMRLISIGKPYWNVFWIDQSSMIKIKIISHNSWIIKLKSSSQNFNGISDSHYLKW